MSHSLIAIGAVGVKSEVRVQLFMGKANERRTVSLFFAALSFPNSKRYPFTAGLTGFSSHCIGKPSLEIATLWPLSFPNWKKVPIYCWVDREFPVVIHMVKPGLEFATLWRLSDHSQATLAGPRRAVDRAPDSKLEVLGSIPSLATYFRSSFR